MSERGKPRTHGVAWRKRSHSPFDASIAYRRANAACSSLRQSSGSRRGEPQPAHAQSGADPVYATQRRVDHVVVSGRVIVEHDRVLTVDAEATLTDVPRLAEAIGSKGGA
jgi:hypothetical protein